MIFVDSSVWIDFFNGRDNPRTQRLADLLEDAASPLGMADLVLFEVLRGFRYQQDALAARQTLAILPVIEIGGEHNVINAAEHYRHLRNHGYTIRSPIDVLLASYCIEQGYALLHNDRDFDALETLCGLKVWLH